MVTTKEMSELIIDALLRAEIIKKQDEQKASEIIEEELRVRLCLGGIELEEIFEQKCPPDSELINYLRVAFEDIPDHYFDCLNCLKSMMTEKMKLFVDEKMTLEEFMEWFVPATWQLNNDKQVSGFKLFWAEYTNGHRTDEEFRSLIKKEVLKI